MHEKRNTGPSTETVIQLLFDLAPHVEISDHTPGKITMKFRLSGLGVIQDASIKEFGRAIPGIKKATTSLWKRSVIIEYDEKDVSPDTWEDLVNANHDPEKRKLLQDRLRAILDRTAS